MFAYVLSQVVSTTDTYQKQLKKARKEYERMKRHKVVPDDSTRLQALGYRYDLLGHHLKNVKCCNYPLIMSK